MKEKLLFANAYASAWLESLHSDDVGVRMSSQTLIARHAVRIDGTGDLFLKAMAQSTEIVPAKMAVDRELLRGRSSALTKLTELLLKGSVTMAEAAESFAFEADERMHSEFAAAFDALHTRIVAAEAAALKETASLKAQLVDARSTTGPWVIVIDTRSGLYFEQVNKAHFVGSTTEATQFTDRELADERCEELDEGRVVTFVEAQRLEAASTKT